MSTNTLKQAQSLRKRNINSTDRAQEAELLKVWDAAMLATLDLIQKQVEQHWTEEVISINTVLLILKQERQAILSQCLHPFYERARNQKLSAATLVSSDHSLSMRTTAGQP